jgi:hypothetical protein
MFAEPKCTPPGRVCGRGLGAACERAITTRMIRQRSYRSGRIMAAERNIRSGQRVTIGCTDVPDRFRITAI